VIVLERHDQLDFELYRRVVLDREHVRVEPGLLEGVDAGRAALLAHVKGGAHAYGINTGLGYLTNRTVQTGEEPAFQRSILVGRASAVGPPLSEPVVRGVMLLRLTGFLAGYAGVSGALCSFIVDRLNGGWAPAVPAGATGTAGEIVPLAHLFQTFVGEGAVLAGDRLVGAREALAANGIEPLTPGAKEGLALINGAPLAPALAILLGWRAERLVEHATLAGALAVALMGASVRPYSARVGQLKGDSGQLRVHERVMSLLSGAARMDDALQAPVSMRVLPQVHGAALDLLGHLGAQLQRELRAVTDSPVFLPAADGEPEGLYSTGNFHAQAVTLPLEALAIAVAHVLNLVEKRLHRLLDARFSGLPDQLARDPGRQSGLVTLHKQVVGLAAQARTLATPASIHALDTSAGQEDLQSHTLLVALRLEQSLSCLELGLAYELVALRQARDLAGMRLPGELARAADAVAELVPEIAEDRSMSADVERVRRLIASGRLVPGAPRSEALLAPPSRDLLAPGAV
jgi:histidine ammonia-lyase